MSEREFEESAEDGEAIRRWREPAVGHRGHGPFTVASGSFTSTAQTYSSSTPNRVVLSLNDDSWVLSVLEETDPVRGGAVGALARWMAVRHGIALRGAVELAVDLLRVESDDTCHAVSTLISDNWADSVGALLHAARRL